MVCIGCCECGLAQAAFVRFRAKRLLSQYVAGDKASYNGHVWTAQWWTQGETPGQFSVWADNGACLAIIVGVESTESSKESRSVLPSRLFRFKS